MAICTGRGNNIFEKQAKTSKSFGQNSEKMAKASGSFGQNSFYLPKASSYFQEIFH
jgi:hypothetical protein